MGRYELLFITKSGMSRDAVKEVVKNVTRIIFERDGIVRKINTFGERVLPYRMARHKHSITEGRYMLVDFICESKRMGEVDRYLLMEENVIRHGAIRTKDPHARFTAAERIQYNAPPDLSTQYRPKKKSKQETAV